MIIMDQDAAKTDAKEKTFYIELLHPLHLNTARTHSRGHGTHIHASFTRTRNTHTCIIHTDTEHTYMHHSRGHGTHTHAYHSDWVEVLLETLGAVHIHDQHARSPYLAAVRASRDSEGKDEQVEAVLKAFQVGWSAGWVIRLVGWSVGRSVGRSVGWLIGWLVDWLVGWLVGWFDRWLVGLLAWLIRSLVGWLVGWLVARSVGLVG